MGCSNNTSFEINKSDENIEQGNKDDGLNELRKIRMKDNQEKQIEDNDLIKIKKLSDDFNENNNNDNNDNDNEENDIILNNLKNNKENILKSGNSNNANKENNNNGNNEDNKENDNNINNMDVDSPEEIAKNNETGNIFTNNTLNNNISIIDKYIKTKKTDKSTLSRSSNLNNTKNPFTLKTTKGDSINIATLKINATYFLREYLIPIWFKKDAFIKFATSGKWRIDKTCDFTDTKGMPTSNTLGFNYGACIARIGPGEPFVILPNNFTYTTKNEGPLYLKMNLPRKLKLLPEGQIEMNIYDGEVLTIEEVYERIGWIENTMKYKDNKGSELENGLMTYINNLRMNPILFHDKYFRDIQNILWIEKYLKEKEIKNKNMRKPFNVNDKCYEILDKYININYVNKKNINRQKVSLYLNEMKENLELYLNSELKYKNYINCKFTQKYKVQDICFQYLLDKKFRNHIFTNDYNYLTIKIVENYVDESNLLIFCLSKVKNTDENNANDDIN